MRIRLIAQFGAALPGSILEVNYTMGANLIFTGHAIEVIDEPAPEPVAKAMDAAPKDKMIRKPKARRKAGERKRPYGTNQDA